MAPTAPHPPSWCSLYFCEGKHGLYLGTLATKEPRPCLAFYYQRHVAAQRLPLCPAYVICVVVFLGQEYRTSRGKASPGERREARTPVGHRLCRPAIQCRVESGSGAGCRTQVVCARVGVGVGVRVRVRVCVCVCVGQECLPALGKRAASLVKQDSLCSLNSSLLSNVAKFITCAVKVTK